MVVKALFINLDRDTERRARMEAEFEKHGLSFQRLPAFLADAIPENYRNRFVPPSESVLFPPERGCFASHLCALDHVGRAAADEIFLICEDDVTFSEDFSKVLSHDLTKLRFDIIRLSESPKSPSFMIEQCAEPYKVVRYSRIPNLTGAYLVTSKGARKILARAYGLDIPYDDFLRRSWIADLETYGIIPAPVHHLPGPSSIDPGRQRGRMKRRRYRCAHDGTAKRLKSRIVFVGQIGLARAVKYLLARAKMKLTGTKQDKTGQYIVP
jgi:glycosyl transferase family 25